MSGKRRKREKSRGTIKGGVGGKASADAEGVEENRERNFGTMQLHKKKKRKTRRKTYQKSIPARYNRL